MSRTIRKVRPRVDSVRKRNYVRDGTLQYISTGCQHNKGCCYCEGNRLYSSIVGKQSADDKYKEYFLHE